MTFLQIMPLYEQALQRLQLLPADIDVLHQLAPLLSSSFTRIPPPALGPIAFKKFWDATFQGASPTPRGYPDSIKCCLRAYHEVYGGDPPTGVTIGSSQSSSADAPQLLELPRTTHSRLEEDRLRTSGSEYPHSESDWGQKRIIRLDHRSSRQSPATKLHSSSPPKSPEARRSFVRHGGWFSPVTPRGGKLIFDDQIRKDLLNAGDCMEMPHRNRRHRLTCAN
jgi:hypothetical protein